MLGIYKHCFFTNSLCSRPKTRPNKLAIGRCESQFLFGAKRELRTSLDLIHFFIPKISSKFTFRFFKIFLKVPRNIFKIFHNFPGHLINFPYRFTISEKNLLISQKSLHYFPSLIKNFTKSP